MFEVSRYGESVPDTSWWSRPNTTGAEISPRAIASLNASAILVRPSLSAYRIRACEPTTSLFLPASLIQWILSSSCPGDLLRSGLADLFEHFGSQTVRSSQVFGFARRTYPAEGTEAVVEEHRAHDILHIGRIAETTALAHDVGTGTRRLQQEGIAVIEEIHTLGGQLVDRSHLAAQRLLNTLLKLLGILCHHAVGLFVAQADRDSNRLPRGCAAMSGRNPDRH